MTQTCKNCRYSFLTGHQQKEILRCWPAGNRNLEQIAYKLCDQHQPIPEQSLHMTDADSEQGYL